MPVTQQLARQALYWGHEVSATAMVWDTPLTGLVARLGKAHLRRQVKDPWLRRQLTPEFTPGCKRMLVSSDYYPALQRDNCKLIDWPIATMSPVGIRTSDGVEHHLDCIVFATGYDVHLTGPPYPVTGIGGRSLADEWVNGAQAYKSINAHGYPNLFLMTGPNSGPGHNSLLVYVEGQIDYAVRGIATILRDNLRYLDVREDVQRRYNRRIQKRLTKTTWMSGCSSWYLTKDGFNASMYPGFATQYLRQMRDFRFGDYEAAAREATVHAVTVGLRCRLPGSHGNPRGRSRRSSSVSVARHGRSAAAPATSSRTRCPSCSTRPCSRTVSRPPASTASRSSRGWRAPPPATSASTATAACCTRRCGWAASRCSTTRHLTRLRLITSLLDRGYNISHVHEMLSAWEQGKDVGDMLGLEIGDRGQLGHREAGADERRRRQAAGRRRRPGSSGWSDSASSGSRTARQSSCGPS